MDKPFLPIEQQVHLLNSRGMETDSNTEQILMREGYYSIVNGYKDPFLDRQKTQYYNDDRYLPHTKFCDVYALFQIDRGLRELVFPYLLRSEATVKTAVAYCFSDAHREPDAYLAKDNYCLKNDYKNPARYNEEIDSLLTYLKERASDSNSPFIVHYRTHHHSIPLWVLANNLTFGNISHFYNLMKPKEKASVCKMIIQSVERHTFTKAHLLSAEKAVVSLEVLYKFRNKCAHGDRLYNAYVGQRKHINFIGMIKRIEPFLTIEEYAELTTNLFHIIQAYQKRGGTISGLLTSLGYTKIISNSPRNTEC